MEKAPMHSYISIKEGKTAALDGVVNIERFDERSVSLLSEVGKIEIEGDSLKIESLTKENGVVVVSGRIDGVFYQKDLKSEGFFKKIFG